VKARVLVTGVGGPAGRSLSVQLMKRGHAVVGVDMAPVVLDGIEFHFVPPASDPDFVPALSALREREGVDLVVPTVTEELVVIAAVRQEITVPVVVGEAAAVTVADDKLLTCRHLSVAGVAVPRFALPSEVLELDDVTAVLGLPFISKPRRGRGGRGTAVHEKATLASFDDSTILQEFIPGVEYAPNLYLAADPRDDVVVVLEKTELAHGVIGNAIAVRRVVADDVAAVAHAAGRAIGLTGPVDLDVRRRADGTPVVLEINARFGANSAQAPEVLDALLAEHLGGEQAAA